MSPLQAARSSAALGPSLACTIQPPLASQVMRVGWEAQDRPRKDFAVFSALGFVVVDGREKISAHDGWEIPGLCPWCVGMLV